MSHLLSLTDDSMRARSRLCSLRLATRGLLLGPALAGVILSACKDSSGPTSGTLTLTVSGLPSGVAGSVMVTGPSSYTKSVSSGESIAGLTPGSYTVAASSVTDASGTYGASPASQTVTIAASATPVPATVSYALITGGMTVTIAGVPTGSTGAVTLTGPGGYTHPITATETIVGLTPGAYSLNASPVTTSAGRWGATTPTQQLTITAGATPTPATVTYALETGSLTITVAGLPSGAGSVVVTGPGGYTQAITATPSTLAVLAPGTYTIAAANTVIAPNTYGPTQASQTATVAIGLTPTAATVTYAVVSGQLTVTVAGLPGSVNASVAVTGPNGYSQTLTATQTLTNVLAGTYTIVANPVVNGATSYAGAPASQTKAVTAGATATATVTYSVTVTSTLNLTIAGLYITQSTQTFAGAVPLIAGRAGELRVFVLANQTNSAAPAVRVRFYSGSTLVQTNTLTAPSSSVVLAANEAVLASSWNLALPASLIQPNLKVLADVDPTGGIAESNKADNSFPVNGTALALDVRTAPVLNVTFIPVSQTANGVTGNVTAANVDQFMARTMKVWPIPGYSAIVHAVFTTSAPALQSDDANRAWSQILGEISGLRGVEGSARDYYGVVHATYGSGIAGLGYVGYPAAVGWDYLPSGDGVTAHELGHNFGRAHAPCGGASGPDPSYPYANAIIGMTGFDIITGTLHQTSDFDLMSYCNPAWVSDYNYSAVLAARGTGPDIGAAAIAAPQRTLLVWGRISNDEIVLEPAFVVTTRPLMPARTGPYRVDAVDAGGASIFSLAFAGEEVADVPGGVRLFSFAVPLTADAESRLAELRLTVPGRAPRALRSAAAMATPPGVRRAVVPMDPQASVSSAGDGRVQLTWNAATHPMVLVRDATTGEVLSFARGGAATVARPRGDLELTFSDQVRSTTRTVRP
ncbi:MAG: hypothetical protein ABJD07_01740 [Gemmatimonadaceae bacterium]